MATPPASSATLLFAPHEQDHTILNPGDMWWWVKDHPWLSAAELFETYLATVGRGTTYILNMPPNTTGIIPEYLTNETAQLGKAVQASFAPASALSRLANQTVQCGPSAPALLLPPPPGGGTFAFDAVMLEEDLGKGNQRISGYALQTCTEAAGECSDAQWVTVSGANATQKQTVTLGATVGRKVIERGFGGQDGVPITVTGLRFKCTAAFPAGTTTAYLKSFSAHKIQAPKGWPKDGGGCQTFNCTCRGMADYFGVGGSSGAWGCAPKTAQDWWVHSAKPCEQPGYSCCGQDDYTKRKAPYPGCK